MVTTKQHDLLNRLTNISSSFSSSSSSSTYLYNSANQRTVRTEADGSYWVYQYDSLGQVTSGKKYWPNGTPVAGHQFEYAFDDIGNRTLTASGGNQWGSNLRYAHYDFNSLNQYTKREVPGYVNVIGAANADATVTLWAGDAWSSLFLTC
jgi:YD repeat-containing protein